MPKNYKLVWVQDRLYRVRQELFEVLRENYKEDQENGDDRTWWDWTNELPIRLFDLTKPEHIESDMLFRYAMKTSKDRPPKIFAISEDAMNAFLAKYHEESCPICTFLDWFNSSVTEEILIEAGAVTNPVFKMYPCWKDEDRLDYFRYEEPVSADAPRKPKNLTEPPVGISLRDYFAAAALQNMANPGLLAPRVDIGKTLETHAKVAYMYADAMLKAREE